MNEDPKRIVVSGTYKQKELLCTGAPIFDRQHRLKTIVISIQDMSALNTLRKKLEEQRLYTKSYMREISLFNGSGGPIGRGRKSSSTKFITRAGERTSLLSR